MTAAFPADLETICQKALQKTPDSRYTSVGALLEDLRRFEAGEPLVARRASILFRSTRWIRRHWKIAATVLVTAALTITVASPLLDRSFDDIMAWGDEEMTNGNASVAAQVYSRALRGATDGEKRIAVHRIVQACRSMPDSKLAVPVAMQIIDMAPTESFGKHNYIIARAVVAREHRNANLGETNIWNSKPESVLQLVKSRLELALAGGLPDEQALEAEQILTDVNLAIANGSYPTRYHPEYLHKLPEGDVEDLLRMLK